MIKVILITSLLSFTAGRAYDYYQSYDLTKVGNTVNEYQTMLEKLPVK